MRQYFYAAILTLLICKLGYTKEKEPMVQEPAHGKRVLAAIDAEDQNLKRQRNEKKNERPKGDISGIWSFS